MSFINIILSSSGIEPGNMVVVVSQALTFCLAFSIPSHSTLSCRPLHRERSCLSIRSCVMQSWLQSWDPRIVTREAERQMSKILTKNGEYCGWDQLSPTRISEIERDAKGLMSQEQARSLRKQLLVEKCRSGSFKISKSEKLMKDEYESKRVGILDLSFRLDIPPIAILRAILKMRVLENWRRMPGQRYAIPDDRTVKLHKTMVKEALRGNDCELLALSARDRAELAAASEADEASFEGVDPREKEDAAAFEASVHQVQFVLSLSSLSSSFTSPSPHLQFFVCPPQLPRKPPST